jgi:putative transposase
MAVELKESEGITQQDRITSIGIVSLSPSAPSSPEEVRRVVERFVAHYNGVRLHNAIGCITPNDFLAGRSKAIWAERDQKLAAARELRRVRREAARQEALV